MTLWGYSFGLSVCRQIVLFRFLSNSEILDSILHPSVKIDQFGSFYFLCSCILSMMSSCLCFGSWLELLRNLSNRFWSCLIFFWEQKSYIRFLLGTCFMNCSHVFCSFSCVLFFFMKCSWKCSHMKFNSWWEPFYEVQSLCSVPGRKSFISCENSPTTLEMRTARWSPALNES